MAVLEAIPTQVFKSRVESTDAPVGVKHDAARIAVPCDPSVVPNWPSHELQLPLNPIHHWADTKWIEARVVRIVAANASRGILAMDRLSCVSEPSVIIYTVFRCHIELYWIPFLMRYLTLPSANAL